MNGLISHGRRVYYNSVPDCSTHYNDPVKVLTKNRGLEKDRFAVKSSWSEVLPSSRFEGMNASDFALENIIAVGALDSLKECKLQGSRLDISDEAQAFMDSLKLPDFDIVDNNNIEKND